MEKKSQKLIRIMVNLSKEDIRLLDLLSQDMGESRSQVVKRGIIMLSCENSKQKNKACPDDE